MIYLNYISGLIIVLICMMSLYSHNNFYIDIAIIYAILNFIASFAFANYLTNKNQETGNE